MGRARPHLDLQLVSYHGHLHGAVAPIQVLYVHRFVRISGVQDAAVGRFWLLVPVFPHAIQGTSAGRGLAGGASSQVRKQRLRECCVEVLL